MENRQYFFLLLLLIGLIGCRTPKDSPIPFLSVKDTSGNVYRTVKIGDQTWMADNLRTSKYNDGTDIPLVEDSLMWLRVNAPAHSWYNNDKQRFENPFGALYNWHTVNTGKLCPTGWHIPNNAEWTILVNNTGGFDKAADQLKATSEVYWFSPNKGANNASLFSAVAAGGRFNDFKDFGEYCVFWSASYKQLGPYYIEASSWALSNGYSDVTLSSSAPPHYGFSVRCIKD